MTTSDHYATDALDVGVSRWRQIRDALARDLDRGQWAIGERLPSEQSLASRFDVHRHTVRQALQALARDGWVRTEHGRGTFACPKPMRYPVGARMSFTANVTDQGRTASRVLEDFETLRASAALATELDIRRGGQVLRIVTVAFADDVPLARGQHYFALARVPGIGNAIRETGGISAALARIGVTGVRRARTRISTRAATPAEASALMLADRQPVLVTESLDVMADGRPMQAGVTAFAGNRVELEVLT